MSKCTSRSHVTLACVDANTNTDRNWNRITWLYITALYATQPNAQESKARQRTCSVDAGHLEVIEQLHRAKACGVGEVRVAHALEQADLVERCLSVVLRAAHHLHRHEPLPAARTRTHRIANTRTCTRTTSDRITKSSCERGRATREWPALCNDRILDRIPP